MASTSGQASAEEVSAARRYFRSWLKPPRQLQLTRAGKFFCALTLGVGLGALNTGNNLLFLLEGMLLASIMASGVLSEASLRKIKAGRSLPKQLHEALPARGSFWVESFKAYPSVSLAVHELRARAVEGPAQGEELKLAKVRWWQFWKVSQTLQDSAFVAAAYLAQLEPRGRKVLAASWEFPRRGRWELEALAVMTRFPFALFEKRRNFDQVDELWVYPQLRAARDWSGDIFARFGDVPAARAGMGEEFFELRELRDGEDRRMVHWKSSAKRGKLLVRQQEEQRQRAIELIVLTGLGADREPSPLDRARFERGLSRICGLIQDLGSAGWQLGLQVPGLEGGSMEIGPTHAGRIEAMYRLLCVSVLRPGPPAPLMAAPERGPGQPAVARIALGMPQALAMLDAEVDLQLAFDASDEEAAMVSEGERGESR